MRGGVGPSGRGEPRGGRGGERDAAGRRGGASGRGDGPACGRWGLGGGALGRAGGLRCEGMGARGWGAKRGDPRVEGKQPAEPAPGVAGAARREGGCLPRGGGVSQRGCLRGRGPWGAPVGRGGEERGEPPERPCLRAGVGTVVPACSSPSPGSPHRLPVLPVSSRLKE